MTTPSSTSTAAGTCLHIKPKPPFIVLPLYIYPGKDNWAPLFDAAKRFPKLSFVVVINPNNGPGDTHRPDINYVHVLRTLATFSNITILGYVHCRWGERNRAHVAADISQYYNWELGDHNDLVGHILALPSPVYKDTTENGEDISPCLRRRLQRRVRMTRCKAELSE